MFGCSIEMTRQQLEPELVIDHVSNNTQDIVSSLPTAADRPWALHRTPEGYTSAAATHNTTQSSARRSGPWNSAIKEIT